MFQRHREARHFVKTFRLDAFWLRAVLRRFGRNAAGQMGLEIVPQRLLARLGQPAGEATPHHPEFAPDRLFGVKFYTFAKQEKRLLAAPLVQRVTESRAQTVAGELEKHPLVIG